MVSSTFDPATGLGTITLSDGTVYTTTGYVPVSDNSFTVSFSISRPGSPTFSGTVTATDLEGPLLQLSGTTSGTGSFSCVVNEETGETVSGDCGSFGSLFGVSSSVATTQQSVVASSAGITRSQTRATTTIISDRIRGIAREITRSRQNRTQTSAGPDGKRPHSGLSAGSEDTRWGVWFDASGSLLRNNTAAFGYDGYSVTALGGVDYLLTPDWVVGMVVGYTRADLDLKAVRGNRTSNGAVVGPYASYIINQNFALDASFTYTYLANDVIVNTARGDFNSNRYTGSINLNGFYDPAPFTLTGFTGYAYSIEYVDGYTDTFNAAFPSSTIRYGAIKIGGEAGYPIGDFEPYIPLVYEYETTEPLDGTTRSSLTTGIGIRYRYGDRITAGFSAVTQELKSHTTDVSLAANIRIMF